VVYWNLEDLRSLEAQLELTRAQQEDLRSLSAPILEAAPGVLLLPLVGRMDAVRADHIADRLLHAIGAHAARAALIDVTGLSTVDTAAVAALAAITRAATLMGTRCLLCGVSPASALQMIDLNVRLDGVSIFASASAALASAMRRS
jgi:anti-anti-sigma regulatory factor